MADDACNRDISIALIVHVPPGYAGRLLTDHRTRCAYAEGAGPYRIVPAAVALPRDAADVAALTVAANESGWALIPRGAGSGMPGGNVGRGIVVDLQALRKPCEIREGQALVGPAVTWRELDTLAAPFGLRLPPDPSSGAFCTIGGMVATNAAGARSVRYGPIRPWVAAIEMVSGDGATVRCARDGDMPGDGGLALRRFVELVDPEVRNAAVTIRSRFPQTRKNTAGYALDRYLETGQVIDVLIGSEGTLGVITGVALRLDPRPAAVASLLVALPSLEGLPDAVEAVRIFDPSAIEFLDRSYLQIAQFDALPIQSWAGALLIDFEGTEDQVRTAVHGAAAAVTPPDATSRIAVTSAERDLLWSLRHAASPVLARLPDTRRSLQIIEDGCVPVKQLGAYIVAVHAIADDIGVPIVAFGHAGDGHLHVNALADTTDRSCQPKLDELLRQVTRLVIELGGTPSGEHGDGRLRTRGVAELYGQEILRLFRLTKGAFDPNGILNPGVIVDHESATTTLTDLKVGSDIEPIPADIAAALRAIEASGSWGTSRLELPGAEQPR